MKLLRWAIINFGLVALLWFGIVHDVEGAKNVGIFVLWLAIVMQMLCFSETICDRLIEGKVMTHVPPWLDYSYDVAMVLFLAWFGWFWLAGFYCAAAMIQAGGLYNARKRAAAKEETDVS